MPEQRLVKDTFQAFLDACVPLSGIFFLSFVVTPATIYGLNQQEMLPVYWQSALFPMLAWVGACVALLLLGCISRGVLRYITPVSYVAMLTMFVVNFFLPVHSLDINNQQTVVLPLLKDPVLYKELALFLVFAVLYCVSSRIVKVMANYAIFFSLMFVGYVGMTTHQPSIGGNSYASFSNTKNVIVLSFDHLENDVLTAALKTFPDLAPKFDGFTRFTDVSSYAPITSFSILSTLTGKEILRNPTFQIRDDLFKASTSKMLPAIFTEQGYLSSVYAYYPSILLGSKGQIYSRGYQASLPDSPSSGYLALLDMSIQRIFPLAISSRTHHYFQHPPPIVIAKLLDFFSFSYMTANMTIIDQPVFKFYHYLSPHEPIMFDAQCTYQLFEKKDRTFDAAVSEMHCILNEVSKFFEALKEKNIYNNAMIIVTSDHGFETFGQSIEASKQYKRFSASKYWPILLIKPANARGGMKESGAPVSLVDIAPTVCYEALLTLSCDSLSYDGLNLLGSRIVSDRARSYMFFVKDSDNVTEIHEDMTLYETRIFRGNSGMEIGRSML